MKSSSRAWIEAAKLLSKDRSQAVKCPECNVGTLVVKDEPINNQPGIVDRYLICDQCGQWNVISKVAVQN